MFTNEVGEHYKTFTFYRRFKAIAQAIGRPDARPHDLRHTAATVAIANGVDIKSVQSMLGHATASFTLDVYAHTSQKMMEAKSRNFLRQNPLKTKKKRPKSEDFSRFLGGEGGI